MQADLTLKVSNADRICKTLKPEIEKTKRFEVSVKSSNENLNLKIKAKDITAMKAAINSYLRLIKLADDLEKK